MSSTTRFQRYLRDDYDHAAAAPDPTTGCENSSTGDPINLPLVFRPSAYGGTIILAEEEHHIFMEEINDGSFNPNEWRFANHSVSIWVDGKELNAHRDEVTSTLSSLLGDNLVLFWQEGSP